MRPIARLRTSDLVSANIPAHLYIQAHAYCATHNIKPSALVRFALHHFFDNPHLHTITDPNATAPKTHTITTMLNSAPTTYATTSKPKANPHATLRDRLDIYSTATRTTVTSIIAKALYIYLNHQTTLQTPQAPQTLQTPQTPQDSLQTHQD